MSASVARTSVLRTVLLLCLVTTSTVCVLHLGTVPAPSTAAELLPVCVACMPVMSLHEKGRDVHTVAEWSN
ncbi:hypothetical protein B0H16DRAFT_1547882 [Mycena metata]|uniref:Secreted protein n=1 Tax=Mycena metata TaxID=1033252 RepID=A0AAD7IW27_9AGAR|nr:hypothetical protein B0H16DRAFT_1547882 [Mycena metata]